MAEDTARAGLATATHDVEVGSSIKRAMAVGTRPGVAPPCREVRARRKLLRSGRRRAAERDTGVESGEGGFRSGRGRRESSVIADVAAAAVVDSEWEKKVLQLEGKLAVEHIPVSGEIREQETFAAAVAAAPVAQNTGHPVDSPSHSNIAKQNAVYSPYDSSYRRHLDPRRRWTLSLDARLTESRGTNLAEPSCWSWRTGPLRHLNLFYFRQTLL